jgi:hypothetical protein
VNPAITPTIVTMSLIVDKSIIIIHKIELEIGEDKIIDSGVLLFYFNGIILFLYCR